MKVPKEFNPSVSSSTYLTRHLLFVALTDKRGVLGSPLLDFGTGSAPYRSLFNVHDYVGLDYEGEGHSHEKESIDIFYDGKHIPFNNNFFSSVLCTEVMEHIFNLEEVIKELYRVMKPNALMLITKPFICAQHEVPNDCSRYTEYGIKNLLQRNNFKIIYYEKIGTSIQAQFQMFMSYLDSYVICKFKKLGIYKPVSAIIFTCLNLLCMLINNFFPKRYDAFLNHLIIVKKSKN